ncbi:hypothetical protein A9K55_006039 [Cordyceps militaris]|uniref:Uncharacterized protein n=1 Tax=Cordyceps militaris TaxID=73501 RepID=A0A2H4SCG2_CORMI|nr:hypothetical protein A9K55_006039 [Cordyceps militaris]
MPTLSSKAMYHHQLKPYRPKNKSSEFSAPRTSLRVPVATTFGFPPVPEADFGLAATDWAAMERRWLAPRLSYQSPLFGNGLLETVTRLRAFRHGGHQKSLS